MSIIKQDFGEIGGGNEPLELVDSLKNNNYAQQTLTHTCTKNGYYYVTAFVTGYNGSQYGGTITITHNGTAIDSSEYLQPNVGVNTSRVASAIIDCNIDDTIVVSTKCNAGSANANIILIFA